MRDWFETGGNVRQMHSPFLPPAGKGIELVTEPDGEYVRSKIFEPSSMKQVLNGGYQAYSVGLNGIRKIRDARAPNGRIVDGKIVEISLVDRPANATCKVSVAKAVGLRPDAPIEFLGGYDEAEVAAMKAATPAPSDDHTTLQAHDHTHADGTAHKHAHVHEGGAPTHDAVEHAHAPADVIKTHRASASSSPHLGMWEHAHEHADGVKHTHLHDHAPDALHHDSHAHIEGVEYAKAAGVTTHDSPHDETATHSHTHVKGDRFVAAGEDHSHPHDHADGSAGHDGHMSDHADLLPASQKAATAGAPPPTSLRLDPAAAPVAAPLPDGAQRAADAIKAAVADAGADAAPYWKRDYSDETRQEMADKGQAKPDGSYPIKTRADVENAVRAWGRGGATQSDKDHIVARAKDIGATDALPADWPGSTKKDGSASKAATPAPAPASRRKNGVASALGPTACSLLFQMLQQEVVEDGGTGSESDDIMHLAKAYDALADFLQDEANEPNEPGLYSVLPNALKQLHDTTCPGLEPDAVKAAWPDTTKGLTSFLRVPQATVYQLLSLALNQDAGKGLHVSPIASLGPLYAALTRLAPANDPDPGQTELNLADALATMRKSFANGIPTLSYTVPTFRDSSTLPAQHVAANAPGGVNPREFSEAVLSTARATPDFAGVPILPAHGRQIDASDFSRSGDVPGQARSSAPDGAPPSGTSASKAGTGDGSPAMANAGRRYYTNAARDLTIQSLRNVHDSLVAMHPDICPAMDAAAGAAKGGAWAGSHEPRPLADSSLPSQGALPSLVKTETPDVTKAAAASSGAAAVPEAMKAVLAEVASLRETITSQQAMLSSQGDLIRQIAGQPDPNAAPMRGGLTTVVVDKNSHAQDAQKRARREGLVDRGRTLSSWLRAGNPDPNGQYAAQLQDIQDELAAPTRLAP